jgi:hypothetical protein
VPAGTSLIAKAPSFPVIAPIASPSTAMLTFASACWLMPSITRPVILPVSSCANSEPVQARLTMRVERTLRVIDMETSEVGRAERRTETAAEAAMRAHDAASAGRGRRPHVEEQIEHVFERGVT